MLKELLSGSQAVAKRRGLLIPRINQYLLTRAPEKSRYRFWIRDMRETEKQHDDFRFHPSRIAGEFCPREWVIGKYLITDVEREPAASKSERIFDVGDAYHDMVQFWLADMGILYGRWEWLM